MSTTKNPPLSDLQSWMRWVLTHPKGVGYALQHNHPLRHCVNVIGQTPTVDRETRLSIYGNGYFLRIIEVLENNFSSMKNILGEHDFDHLAHAYLVKHPSTFKSIDDIGAQMSDFVKKYPISKKFLFMSDLASLEWATHQSFFADDVPLLDAKQFKKIPEDMWQNARFTLDPSVRLLKLNWPVIDLWRDDGEWKKSKIARLKKETVYALVFRIPEKFVRVPRITPIQFDLLKLLSQGQPLGPALLAIVKKHSFDDQSLPVNEWFQHWIQDGVFKKIEFSSK